MEKELPIRKHPRLKGYNYSSNGVYFLTLCVEDRHEMLGKIVGRDVLIAPENINAIIAPYIELSDYGKIVDKHINKINSLNNIISVDNYVIMPNHIHILITIQNFETSFADEKGAMRTSRPTSTSIPSVMRSFKTMVTKEIGFSLWQTTYHDHIIRDEADYQCKWQYIDQNPAKWAEDEFYNKMEFIK